MSKDMFRLVFKTLQTVIKANKVDKMHCPSSSESYNPILKLNINGISVGETTTQYFIL